MEKLLIVVVALSVVMSAARAETSDTRETVLDRKTHILEELVLDVPHVPPLCDTIKGLTKGKIDIGDCKLYCEQEGEGTPIVLLSGGPGSTHHIFHPVFSHAAKHARLIYYDQRGVGQSDPDPTGRSYTVRQAVEDLDSLRNALKIDRWVVVGHSYGGFLAQCYALEHPEAMVGLVLVCARPGFPNATLERTRQYDYLSDDEKAKIDSIIADNKLTPEQRLYNAHFCGDWKRQSFYRPTNDELARMARYEWKPRPGFRDRICPDADRVNLAGKFTNFDIPALIVEGKWDLTWNTDKPGKMLANHPGAKLVMFERSGHGAFADEPDLFFSTLRDFLNSAKAAPAPAADRMGKRIEWPPAVVLKIEEMKWTGEDQQALDLFAEAKTAQLADAHLWFKLGLVLYDGEHYAEGLEAFGQVTSSQESEPIRRFAAHCWQGHLLDLAGRREDALGAYREALGIDIGDRVMKHSQYGMAIDRKWVEERLKTPFDPRPLAVAAKINEMEWTGEDKKSLQLFAEAKKTQLAEFHPWFKLGLLLYDSKHYAEALEAFGQVTSSQESEPVYRFAAHCWQGHLLDLMGRREDALGAYRQALEIDIGDRVMHHSQYRMSVDRKWVEERLKTPFERK